MKRFNSLLATILMAAVLLSFLPKNLKADDAKIDAFIQRLYTNILGRAADQAGLEGWRNKLKNEGWSATQVAKFFYDSNEFKSLNVSDSVFLDKSYLTFLDRTADAGGKAFWLNEMQNSGKKRESIFYNFALSDEFKTLCATYGITPYNNEDGIKAFTVRFYNIILDREADPGGLDFWVGQLRDKKATGVDIAKFFFNSEEYKSKNPSDADFINAVYKTMFDRVADTEGFNYWLGLLNQGVSRDEIIEKMADTPEFEAIEKKYLEISDGSGNDADNGNSPEGECYERVIGATPNNFGKSRLNHIEMDTDGDGEPNMYYYVTYDANNCVTKTVFKIKDANGTIREVSKGIYTYENKLLKTNEQISTVNNQEIPVSKTYYEYYSNNQYKTVKYDNFPVDNNIDAVEYYKEDGSEMTKDNQNDGTIDEKSEYFYQNGDRKRLIKEIETDLVQNMKEITFYTYNEKGNIIEEDMDYSFTPNTEPDGSIDEKTFFEYDQYDNVTATWSESFSPEIEADPRTTFSYDYVNLIRQSVSHEDGTVSKAYFERY